MTHRSTALWWRGIVLALVLLAIMANAVQPTSAATTVYSNDFEGAVGPEWSNTSTDITPIGARRFLGRFGNETVSLTLGDLPPHDSITVTLDAYIIESWDGHDNSAFSGPDVWELNATGGPVLLHTTFANVTCCPEPFLQAYPDFFPGGNHLHQTGAEEVNVFGYPLGEDAVYHLEFSFDHSDDSIAFNFLASGLQGIADESWGLDNVEVSLDGGADATAPRCEVIGVVAGDLHVEVEDVGGGLKEINVLVADNATVDVPAFAVGTNDVVTVVGSKIDASERATITIEAMDNSEAMNRSECDPVLVSLTSQGPTVPSRQTFSGIPGADRYLTLYSDGPAFSLVTVNGMWTTVLTSQRSIDLGPALIDGQDNTVTLWSLGVDGSIMFSDVVPSNATGYTTTSLSSWADLWAPY